MRVEVPAVVMEQITDVVYESKLVYYTKSFDDRVRTFCMNPYGVVVAENNAGLITVNGHSNAEKTYENTNFAILVSKSFTEPFKEPITYGKSIAKFANLLGGGVIVQRLGDLKAGRRSTEERIGRGMVIPTMKDATPGDLSLVLPYRHLTAIMEMLEALDKVAPGVGSRHTLLYGVEVKFYSSRLHLSNALETKIPNFFAVGDGAGVTRGLAQASVSGVVVAREIMAREKGNGGGYNMIERYTYPEMGRIWTDENEFQTMLDIEIYACEIMAELGEVPAAAVPVIKERAKFSVDRIREIEKETRHDILAFLPLWPKTSAMRPNISTSA